MSFRTKYRKPFAIAAVLMGGLAATQAARAASMAQLIVVHGLPGADIGAPNSLPVDVLVDGSVCLLKGFTFGSIVGPVALAPATYKVAISLANSASPCTNTPVINATATLKAGSVSAIVAALSPKGAPTAELFAIPHTPIAQGAVSFVNANASATRVAFKIRDSRGAVYSLPLGVGLSATTTESGPADGYTATAVAPGRKAAAPVAFTQVDQGEALLFAVGSGKTGSLTVLTTELQFQ